MANMLTDCKAMINGTSMEQPRTAVDRPPCFLITAKYPFEFWFMKQGGIFSKNKMPRGKKFKAAVSRFNNGKYVELTPNNFHWERTRTPEIVGDEMSKSHN